MKKKLHLLAFQYSQLFTQEIPILLEVLLLSLLLSISLTPLANTIMLNDITINNIPLNYYNLSTHSSYPIPYAEIEEALPENTVMYRSAVGQGDINGKQATLYLYEYALTSKIRVPIKAGVWFSLDKQHSDNALYEIIVGGTLRKTMQIGDIVQFPASILVYSESKHTFHSSIVNAVVIGHLNDKAVYFGTGSNASSDGSNKLLSYTMPDEDIVLISSPISMLGDSFNFLHVFIETDVDLESIKTLINERSDLGLYLRSRNQIVDFAFENMLAVNRMYLMLSVISASFLLVTLTIYIILQLFAKKDQLRIYQLCGMNAQTNVSLAIFPLMFPVFISAALGMLAGILIREPIFHIMSPISIIEPAILAGILITSFVPAALYALHYHKSLSKKQLRRESD